MPQPSSRDQSLYKRLVISFNDIHDAERYVKRLARVPPSADAPELDPIAYEALQVAFVIAYSRPFSGNFKAPDVDSGLPASFVDSLNPEQRTLHVKLIQLRDQEFAHSDPGPADVTVRVSNTPEKIATAVNAVSATKSRLSPDELAIAVTLVEAHLWHIDIEKARIEAGLAPGTKF